MKSEIKIIDVQHKTFDKAGAKIEFTQAMLKFLSDDVIAYVTVAKTLDLDDKIGWQGTGVFSVEPTQTLRVKVRLTDLQ